LIDLASVQHTPFLRGTGTDTNFGPVNLVEFDYFPDTGFGATIAPTMISREHEFATTFNFPIELVPQTWYRISMKYRAQNRLLQTRVSRDSQEIAPIKDVVLGNTFSNLVIDAFSIHSYSDAGQDPPEFAGSLFARGVIDNIHLIYPDPPVRQFRGLIAGGTWTLEFESLAGWSYTLERSFNTIDWNPVAGPRIGTGQTVRIADETPVRTSINLYRVRANPQNF
jgi:hypothetical protein